MTRFILRTLLAALTITVGVAQALAQAQTLSVAAGNAAPARRVGGQQIRVAAARVGQVIADYLASDAPTAEAPKA